MMVTVVVFAVLVAVAYLIWDLRPADDRFSLRLVQFRPMAPLAGPASSARVRASDARRP